MRECTFEGCTRLHAAKGLCLAHYNQKQTGQTLSPLKKRTPKHVGCLVEDCDRPHNSKGFCRKHYYASVRANNSSPESLVRKKDRQCEVEGCEVIGQRGRGMCTNHYATWWYHNKEMKPVNKNHHNYTDTPAYETIHFRIYRERGKASQFDCVDCDNPALNWSLAHNAPGRTAFGAEVGKRYAGTFYSLNPFDYEPRCDSCHRAYDATYANRKYHTGQYAKAGRSGN